MPTWEEIFTSNNPAGGRMINVISGVAGSEASPYTADNPSGGRAINVNLIGGGSVATGVLQIQGGVPLDTTLRAVTDQANTVSPLQLSTTQVAVVSADGGGLIFKSLGATTGAIYRYGDTPNFNNWKFASDTITTYLNTPVSFQYFIGGSNQIATLTNTGLVIGTTTASARLHVRGDGTNPIARFESSGGLDAFVINSTGSGFQLGSISGVGLYTYDNGYSPSNTGRIIGYNSVLGIGTAFGHRFTNSANFGATTGNFGGVSYVFNQNSAAGNGNFRPFDIAYTINNSGAQTGTATGIFLNATETALNGMTHNLMDLQVGGVSRFKIFNSGAIVANGVFVNGSSRSFITSANDGSITMYNSGGTSFSTLRFGGSTNAEPMLKRNGAAIDFRLADDSGYCDIATNNVNLVGYIYKNATSNARLTSFNNGFVIETGASTTLNASSILDLNSTTRGFLPPRMTTAQKNAIGTPAAGLVVYDTTLNKLCVYTTAWEVVTSV